MFSKTILVCFLITLVREARPKPTLEKPFYDTNKALDYFLQFVKDYNKAYPEGEAMKRFNIFAKNLETFNKQNQEHETSIHGINAFADMTLEEFSGIYLGGSTNVEISDKWPLPPSVLSSVSAPEELDWRLSHIVTGVKDQNPCGSCWAFSAAATIESQYALRHSGGLQDFSEQQLVDCDTLNNGCNNGTVQDAFNYIQQAGLQSLTDYPYVAQQQPCAYDASKVVARVSGGTVLAMSEEDIKAKVATYGPVSITFHPPADLYQTYYSGVLVPTACGSVGHAVVIVGYGTDSASGQQYWLIKNSWGASWGEQGYFRMIRGQDACGMTSFVGYVDVQ